MSKAKPSPKAKKETPLMKQYNAIKGKYPDAILLFRVGDFYETFGADAITVSKALGIVLTKRSNGAASHIELAGFPHHAMDTYLPKLVRAGFRVAICDQLEDPKKTKTIVKRGVTELVTPGVALSDKMLDHKSNNYLASVHLAKEQHGIAFLDVSTGEFLVAQGSAEYLDKLIQSFQPSEILVSKDRMKSFKSLFGEKHYTYALDEWVYQSDYTRETLLNHFQTKSLKGFGVDGMDMAAIAAGAAIHYVGATEHKHLGHITTIARLHRDSYVWMDRFTIRNLELVNSQYDSGTPLIQILDKTVSPMGARMLRKWVLLPLTDKQPIESRNQVVEFFIKNQPLAEEITKYIKTIGDLERLIAKVSLKRINPREVAQFLRAIQALDPIKLLCEQADNEQLNRIGDQINACMPIREKLERELTEEPPVALNKGMVLKNGVNDELDEFRKLMYSGKEYLVQIQQREIEATGITSLKIGFNNVFGYYLEVTNRFKDKAPAEWVRKQTLVNAERYITQELKEYEEKIINAEAKVLEIETRLYEELVQSLMEYIKPTQLNAHLIAQLDCLLSFAQIAQLYNYRKPEINDSLIIDIKDGRHPVIEQQIELGEEYVPNDVFLDSESQQIIIITGPNMSGKSAILRQTALIVLMAQLGSFVPAHSAKIGLTDKIFTRVGASDNISSGESTFMVEMNETASIMNNLSPRSLVLLDEIGRGTSTYDGISIAWSLAEYLHNHPNARAKTLFATHYHELNELANKLERIENYNVSTKEIGQKVIFLRKLVKGGSAHSFGIHVARMAGMPKEIVQRAKSILGELEQKSIASDIETKLKKVPATDYQLNLFSMDNPELIKVKEALDQVEINTLTPVEALLKLNEIKKLLQE